MSFESDGLLYVPVVSENPGAAVSAASGDGFDKLVPYVHASVRPLRPCVLCVLASTWTTSSLSIGYGRIEICPTMDEMELVRTKKGT